MILAFYTYKEVIKSDIQYEHVIKHSNVIIAKTIFQTIGLFIEQKELITTTLKQIQFYYQGEIKEILLTQ